MSWIRLDDGFATNPKIVELTDRELRVWVRVLCYAARLQDPTVDRITIREVPGLTPKTLCRFESVSLLDRVGNSYEIHDWSEYQPKDKTGAERQARYRARRQEQAKPDRYAPVTETVTPDRYSDRYENVTSRARGPVPSRLVHTAPLPEPELQDVARDLDSDPIDELETPPHDPNANGTGAGAGNEIDKQKIDARAALAAARAQSAADDDIPF